MTQRSIEEVINEYSTKRPLYEAFAARLAALFQDLLHDADIDVAHMEARAKTVESFREKIQREGKSYEAPLDEVTDLCGLRIILYTLNDVSKATDLIRVEFAIDDANSVDKSEAIDPDRFGYLSVHYVFTLTPARAKLREWKQYRGLKAEIQIRTILQHSWAAIDHKLRYKSTLEVPRELRRQLFRISALLELADSEFSQIRQRSDELYASYRKEVETRSLEIELNLDSLNAYLAETKVWQDWQQAALEVGYQKPKEPMGTRPEIARSRLFNILALAGIKSIAELDQLLTGLQKNESVILRQIKEYTEKTDKFIPWAVPDDIISFLVMNERRAQLDDKAINSLNFKPSIKEALLHSLKADREGV